MDINPSDSVGPTTRTKTLLSEVAARKAPGLLLLITWPLLAYLYNTWDAPSQPYDEQSLKAIVQDAQSGNSIGQIAILMLALVGATLAYRYRHRLRRSVTKMNLLLGSYLVWNVLSLLWSADPGLALRRVGSLVLLTVFSVGCAARMSSSSLSLYLAVIPTLDLVPGVLAELSYGVFRPFAGQYRFIGTAPHPNVQGASLAVAVLLWSWLSWLHTGKRRLFCLTALTVVTAFQLLTGSRTASIALLVALGCSIMLVFWRNFRTAIPAASAAFFLMTGLAVLALLYTSSSSLHPLEVQQAHGAAGDTLNGRVDLWQSLMPYMLERPLTGYGYGSFWTPQRIEEVSQDQGWTIQQSHSSYIEQMLVLGLPGAILYIAILFTSLTLCVHLFFQQGGYYGAWAALFVFFLVHNFAEAINVNREFTNLAFFTIALHLSMVHSDQAQHDQLVSAAMPQAAAVPWT